MPSPRIHEEFLRHLWLTHSRSAAGLATTRGLPVSVVSPGHPNADGGPDFTDAIIRIARVLYAGDVEIHVRASSWHSHHHSQDPHYNRVILHVALVDDVPERPASTNAGRIVPLLLLPPLLSSDANRRQEGDEALGTLLTRAPLPCLRKDFFGDDGAIRAHLATLGEKRLTMRIRVLKERVHELVEARKREALLANYETAGVPTGVWDEIVYEGVFEAMGYGKNSRPFLELARNVRLSALRRFDVGDALTAQGILFGAAGLLPPVAAVPEKQSRVRVRLLRRRWRELRPYFRVPLLHAGEWLFFRLRPANFPTARLAICAHLLNRLFAPGGIDRIWPMLGRSEETKALPELRKMFSFEADEYWSCHLHFRQKRPGRGISLGEQRFREIVLNTILPLGILRAQTTCDDGVMAGMGHLLRSLPAPPTNAATRPVVDDLLGGKKLRSALEDQGALALVGGWCKTQKCGECPLKI
jgi:hypothetical protein